LVPPLDHAAGADGEGERLAAVDRAVELLPLLAILPEPAGVMDLAGLALGGFGALAFLEVLVAQAALRLRHLCRVDRLLAPRPRGDGRQDGHDDYKALHHGFTSGSSADATCPPARGTG